MYLTAAITNSRNLQNFNYYLPVDIRGVFLDISKTLINSGIMTKYLNLKRMA